MRFLFLLFLAPALVCRAQELSLIPAPVAVHAASGRWLLGPDTRIFSDDGPALGVAQWLSRELGRPTGYRFVVRSGKAAGAGGASGSRIELRLLRTGVDSLGAEGYRLSVTPGRVLITAHGTAGLFYGCQSLLQLFPPDIASPVVVKRQVWPAPCVELTDYPRFAWRGLMLDVSRHFFSAEFVRRYIDEMARCKFNVLHLHLTDDQGWRVEIKGLPRLTELGAWRVPRVGSWWSFLPPQPGEPATYGGYYTQDDIRGLVKYAQERFITIVPEIDVPAHSLALITAYPALSCTGLQYAVNPGSRFKGETNVLCVASDSVWTMLDTIFSQVARLFPGDYIHVGGDEANRSFWGRHEPDRALMAREKLSSPAELQSYFTKRLEQLILSKGKKMIGWDEILEGGISPEATVMSWRGMEGGTKAAKMGHAVIMTPANYAYLDLYQGDPLVEPETYSRLRLSRCYQFEPVPDSVDPRLILGGQGNLWTESVPNDRQAEYMTYPRAFALAEVLWSPKRARNWPDFTGRVERQFSFLSKAGVNYATSLFDVIISGAKGADDSLRVRLETEMPGLEIHYCFDGTNPDPWQPKYAGVPLEVPKGASQIRVRAFRGGVAVGTQINCPLSLLKDRMEK